MRSRRITAVAAVLATIAAMGVASVGTAQAVQTPQASIVTADPANFTPNVLDGKVESIVQIGNKIYAAGLFGHVQLPGNNKPILAREQHLRVRRDDRRDRHRASPRRSTARSPR